jgi:prevent-host-death family protein
MTDSTIVSVTHARETLNVLIERVTTSHEPVTIIGKRANAVLVSEEDWRSIQEKLSLISIPAGWKSLEKGVAESLETFSESFPR